MSKRQPFHDRVLKVHGRVLKAAVFLTVTASLAVAQTRITAPKNKYTPAQDVELGQQAAKEVEQQLPLLRDDGIESFVDRIGRRLVQVTPPEIAASRVPILLQSHQRARDQCVCVAGRARCTSTAA